MITKGLRLGWLLVAVGLTSGGCGGGGDAETKVSKPVDVVTATFGTGTGLGATTRDEFAQNFLGISCAAYLKVCGCDATRTQACSAEKNLAAVDLYDCMFTRAYCASPAGASACPGIGEQSRQVYLQDNALCAQLNAPALRCEAWMRNTFGGQDGTYARALWDTSDPYPQDVDSLIATCKAPPRQ